MAPATTTAAKDKEKLEALEASLGTIQTDLHKATSGMADKMNQLEGSMDDRFSVMERALKQTLEESMNRMRELLALSHESGSSAPPTDNRTGGFTTMAPRYERNNQSHHHRVKLELP